jgi:hypothetical protein
MMDLAEKVFLELEVRGLETLKRDISEIIDHAFRI